MIGIMMNKATLLFFDRNIESCMCHAMLSNKIFDRNTWYE